MRADPALQGERIKPPSFDPEELETQERCREVKLDSEPVTLIRDDEPIPIMGVVRERRWERRYRLWCSGTPKRPCSYRGWTPWEPVTSPGAPKSHPDPLPCPKCDPSPEVCSRCRVVPPLSTRTECMTAYAGELEELNESPWLCRECREEYVDYWTERWDEHNAGRL